jgi:hypothetical protein
MVKGSGRSQGRSAGADTRRDTLRMRATLTKTALGWLAAASTLVVASGAWAQCEPTEIAAEAVVAGALGVGDCTIKALGIDPRDTSFVDVYRVTLGADGFLTVGLESAAFDAFLWVFDETLTTEIASDDDSGGGADSLIFELPLAAGSYLILANSYSDGEEGPYTLTTTFESLYNPACDVEVAHPPNGTASGTLFVPDCTLAQLGIDLSDGSFVDIYRVTLASGGFLTVALESTEIDAYAYLFDDTLTELIGINDDGGGGADSLISQVPLDAATYLILATSYAQGDTGSYTLTTTFELTGNPACDVEVALPPNSVANGALSAPDCTLTQLGLDPDGSFVDIYRVTLASADIVTVGLESAAFDPFLWVFDETLMTEIATDDDSGVGNDSLIFELPLAAGSYLVLANSFEGEETGDYTLTFLPEPSAALLNVTVLGAFFGLSRTRRARR